MNQKLQDAIIAIKAGNRKLGYTLLVEVIKSDPSRKEAEIAWLWMSTVVNDARKKRQSLETVLKINPENKAALQRLAQLDSSVPTNKNFTDERASEISDDRNELETKQCPYCAETIKVKARVCRFCGHQLEDISDAADASLSQPTPTQLEPKSRNQSSYLKIGATFVIVIVLLCIGIQAFTMITSYVGSLSETSVTRSSPTIETSTPRPTATPEQSFTENLITLGRLMDDLERMARGFRTPDIRQATQNVQEVYVLTAKMEQQTRGHPGTRYIIQGLRYHERAAEYFLDYIVKEDDVYLRLGLQYKRDANAELHKGVNTR